jgi:hypothetical protein
MLSDVDSDFSQLKPRKNRRLRKLALKNGIIFLVIWEGGLASVHFGGTWGWVFVGGLGLLAMLTIVGNSLAAGFEAGVVESFTILTRTGTFVVEDVDKGKKTIFKAVPPDETTT